MWLLSRTERIYRLLLCGADQYVFNQSRQINCTLRTPTVAALPMLPTVSNGTNAEKKEFQFFKLFTSLKSVAPSKQFFHVSLMLLEKMDKTSVKDLGKT